MKRIELQILLFSALIVTLPAHLEGSTVRIRLHAALKPETVVFAVRTGEYMMEIPGMEDVRIAPTKPVILFASEGRVAVKWGTGRGVIADSVRFAPAGSAETSHSFSVSVPGVAGERQYKGSMVCRNDNGIFLLLNETDIESYLPGVVLAEGGPGRHREFYKAQAVLARTFAWQNLSKHAADGYNICDDVHCQAYHGIIRDEDVTGAVKETSGIVMVTSDSVPALPAFHSNCGGETASASDAWVTSLPHLQSVADPFCLSSRNATWRASLTTGAWINFLRKNDFTGDPASPGAISFNQDVRKPFFVPGNGIQIPVRSVRTEFGLRSSFFSLIASGDSVIIDGRGYGHGVGMCQEGAMEMARQGYSFERILSFYFRGISLIDIADARQPPVIR